MANEEVEALGAREAMALKLHSNNITCAAFWSEEDLVCTGSMDNTLMLWRVRDGWNHRLRAHCGWVTCCAFQPRGAMLASGILVAVALFLIPMLGLFQPDRSLLMHARVRCASVSTFDLQLNWVTLT
jgi:WD40 repeat protein